MLEKFPMLYNIIYYFYTFRLTMDSYTFTKSSNIMFCFTIRWNLCIILFRFNNRKLWSISRSYNLIMISIWPFNLKTVQDFWISRIIYLALISLFNFFLTNKYWCESGLVVVLSLRNNFSSVYATPRQGE